MIEPSPSVIVLAGPNGAGKTTASRGLLARRLGVMTFVNADVIAQGLCGFDPNSVALEAGRIMLERLHALAEQRSDFAFETTLAARTLAMWLTRLRETGYLVHLYYFWLVSADLAVARVAHRVSQGGHTIPEVTIRQRYTRSLKNVFHLYRPIVTTWHVYDNSLREGYRLLAEGNILGAEEVHDETIWQKLQLLGAE
jgi:predicted ABC-type ATPase